MQFLSMLCTLEMLLHKQQAALLLLEVKATLCEVQVLTYSVVGLCVIYFYLIIIMTNNNKLLLPKEIVLGILETTFLQKY